jgi:hypothetical protein
MPRYLGLLAALLLCMSCAVAVPAPYVHFDERSELPRVNFPDATYQASDYDEPNDVSIGDPQIEQN